MSTQNDSFAEKEKVVVISNEDVKNIRDFFHNFKIEVPAPLETSLVNFESDICYQNQQKIKEELCRLMVKSSHPLFHDDLFAQVIANSTKVAMEAEFNEQLVEVLTRTEEESK